MLTTKEASLIVCVTPSTIRKYINKGVGKADEKEKLPATKTMHGRREIYQIDEIDLEVFKEKWLTLTQYLM